MINITSRKHKLMILQTLGFRSGKKMQEKEKIYLRYIHKKALNIQDILAYI